MIEEAVVMGLGAAKYGPYNWRDQTVAARVYLGAALRHIMQELDGEDLDPESGASHAAHARACLGIYLDAKAQGTLVDDRPVKGKAAELMKKFTNFTKPESKPTPPMGSPEILNYVESLDYEYEQARKLQNEALVAAAKAGEYDDPRKRIVYISGPMRRIPQNNFPAFDAARDYLGIHFDEVISPADMDRADDPALIYTQEYYADRDTAAIKRATHIAVLNGWEHSDGATAEVCYARWIGRILVDAETGGPVTKFNAAAFENGMRYWLGVKA
jgi:hypothetical protein